MFNKRYQPYKPPYPGRPNWWLKCKLMFMQILVPLIIFQLIRTLLFPTTFDVILLTMMIVFYCSLKLKLF
ncbi:hypothetical protein MW695_19495 [Alkalihalobacillus sp. APA_J-10(15)]|nr:hypothetical protein [Halalkalibacter sp. APA_J-10(15)]